MKHLNNLRLTRWCVQGATFPQSPHIHTDHRLADAGRESERQVEVDRAVTYEDRDADCAIWVNYRRMTRQTKCEIDGLKRATVWMPHWSDKAHLRRVQRKVLRECQPSPEDPSFAMTRGKIRSNWTLGTPEHSLESVGWSENPLDRKTTSPRVDIAGSGRTR